MWTFDMSKFDAHLFGPVFSATGVGESARAYWRTLMATGLKVGVFPQAHPYNEEERILSDSFRKYIVHEPHPKLNFCRINAQEINALPGSFIRKKPKTRTDVLIPMWETPSLPSIWKEDVIKFDHIVAATSFIKLSVQNTTSEVPITIVPHVITTIEDLRFTSRSLGLRDDRKYHLYSFAYSSFISRKNPLKFLELKNLFCSENELSSDVFVLASSDSPKNESDISLHKTLMGEQDSNFVYFSGGRSRNKHLSLMANANTFISVHRSEGIGLQLVEALNLGTKIVTHNFSGPSDFIQLNDPGVYKFELKPIGDGEYPHSSGQLWAEMKTRDILNAMSSDQDDVEAQQKMRQRVSEYFSLTQTSEMAARLLSEIS
jgi:glycosyltransferase involved in cell wall biosynthesis